jgi:hypothetical protein
LPQLEQQLMQAAMQSVAPLLRVPGFAESLNGEAGSTAATSGTSTAQEGQPPQQQQQAPDAASDAMQQQQQQPAQDSAQEAGDATTHGVVLIAGFLEVILKLLLEAAGTTAQQQAGVQVQDGLQAESTGPQQQQQQGAGVFVTARHVLLGVAGNADLSSLLLHR